MNTFDRRVSGPSCEGLRAARIRVMQVNVGLRCNQRCSHCHLNCSPERAEIMQPQTMSLILRACKAAGCEMVDITGGAPEMNPDFRQFVTVLRGEGFKVQVRTNLTVLLEPEMIDVPRFLAKHGVQLVASMPCYLEENVRAQRGVGVYERSVVAIKWLNYVGYGIDPSLTLNLVYNPGGPFLPGEQAALEADYRRELGKRFGLRFTNLLTITNMPIGRFRDTLKHQGGVQKYVRLLAKSFNPQTVDALMCRHQVSVGWDGALYDCDFNLALGSPTDHGAPDHVRDFDASALSSRRIVTGTHCFGCTAGAGSSCAGALV